MKQMNLADFATEDVAREMADRLTERLHLALVDLRGLEYGLKVLRDHQHDQWAIDNAVAIAMNVPPLMPLPEPPK